ncbi:4-hydroxyphenylpyruvate dioxygenase [Nitzschia inconspicua]|uniref:4-hydroxyphenylpyruvate dioxygenase n=1 Tax=Nitzschia inconspicua TaxID=303405 RepID=A0A9K3LYQ2_9STRA|nr:4-hydroxyphenylpyruvate dioxygenase [Nitzschia inconspicua]KAG7370473.1 4-hydroxyphenylpyruvate dioxygenase [Nitzschia inconspicua]
MISTGRRRINNNTQTIRRRRLPVPFVRAVVVAKVSLSLLVLTLSTLSHYGCHAFSTPSSTSTSSSISSTTSAATTTNNNNDNNVLWKPKISSLEERRKLRGQKHNSEKIGSIGFHHVEFYCGDAKSTAQQFALSLGLTITGHTGQATGNDQCVSYGLQTGGCCCDSHSSFRVLLTAPYSKAMSSVSSQTTSTTTDNNGSPLVQKQQQHSQQHSQQQFYDAPNPLPNYSVEQAHAFFQQHGLAARAVALQVHNATQAYQVSVTNGAVSVLEPTYIPPCRGQTVTFEGHSKACTMAEVQLYGDVVLRYISFDSPNENDNNDNDNVDDTTTSSSSCPFLPHLAPYSGPLSQRSSNSDFGIYKIDHAVGNVPNLQQAYSYIQQFTGFHEFAEFTTEDVGTIDSGLNSVVLASDSETVLLPINEPTVGKRKSQIQTYLEQNEGPGLQHLALQTTNIFDTVRQMRHVEQTLLGLELMKRPSDDYYNELPDRLGKKLTQYQYQQLQELGILADADDEGVLLQLFTKPVGDRPTFFFEIIQRIGCVEQDEKEGEGEEKGQRQDGSRSSGHQQSNNNDKDAATAPLLGRPGCGGFGQGNFRELFKAIEEHEKTLKV